MVNVDDDASIINTLARRCWHWYFEPLHRSLPVGPDCHRTLSSLVDMADTTRGYASLAVGSGIAVQRNTSLEGLEAISAHETLLGSRRCGSRTDVGRHFH